MTKDGPIHYAFATPEAINWRISQRSGEVLQHQVRETIQAAFVELRHWETWI
ncbi:hypothetical protein QCA50_016794 [Cerrena zonata]|uniref:Uncharacterized protein n=1 Tax=Cerrena zonata TaxID=2478898 RepID=A0AAW0FKI5_9APHY